MFWIAKLLLNCDSLNLGFCLSSAQHCNAKVRKYRTQTKIMNQENQVEKI